MKKLRIGIVGLGGIAGIHIAAYRRIDGAELVAAADSLGKSSRSYGMIKDSSVSLYATYEEMIERENLDAIDICAPSHLHKSIAVYALKRGLHVLCEKPMATSSADADEIIRAARESGKLFMCAQIVRFSRPYAYFRDTVRSGELGRPVQIFMKRLSTVPSWRRDGMNDDAKKNGGVMLDLSIHDIDFVYSVFGEPKVINGVYLPTDKSNVSDVLNANLVYDGYSVNISGAFYESELPFMAEFLAVFEKGYLKLGADGMLYKCLEALPDVKDTAYENEVEGLNIEMSSKFVDEIKYFVDAALSDTPPTLAMPESTAGAIKLAEKIIDSLERIRK